MLKKIRVLIIEDDQNTIKYLERIVNENINYINIIGHSNNVTTSIEMINQYQPEIILMSIMLSEANSFAVLEAFPEPKFEVIFISAHHGHIEKTLKYYAFSFLTKPLEDKKVVKLFRNYKNLRERMFSHYRYEILQEMVFENGKKILLHVGNEHKAINLYEIIHCKADGNYTIFYLNDNRHYLVYKPLGYYSDLLENKGFLRVGRFDLININNVISIYKKETVILSNGKKINISKRNKSKLQMLIEKLSF